MAFVALAIVYFTRLAKTFRRSCPVTRLDRPTHHTKHGIAMLVFAALSVVGAWMLSGPATKSDPGGLS